MPRQRLHTELVNLLDRASQPLYVLDDALVILYLNEAARTWLGAEAEELLGRKCVYASGSELSGLDQAAARLCPPPAVLEGHDVSADVARLADQQMSFRRARFVPLRRPDEEIVCIVALVDSQDRADPYDLVPQSGKTDCQSVPQFAEKSTEADSFESRESQELHAQLQRFRQQAALRYRIERVVGVTPAMRRVRAQAQVAAATRANVVLLGPPGTGRRHLAEAIHYAAPAESRGGLVPLECGLLDVELVQSTLRSAVAEKRGGGTLLLCDADQLSAESQAALAAVLSAAACPWRVLSTAATPLVDLPPRGQYREDLAALLSTISIELPPLAKRRDDLPLLAQALLEEQNTRGGRQIGGFSSAAIDCISAHTWPGNVAELAQVVAECHARAAGTLIGREELPERLRLAAEAAAHPRRKEEPIQLDEFVARIERELIRRALARAKGNKAKAARLLGLNRPRLYRRMVQLGLAEEGEE